MTTSVAPSAVPAKSKVRIQALDVIRGMSILGILAVNADGFAGPMSASLKPAAWFFPNTGWTAFSYWLMDAFFHEKFVTLFSMLFGVSLFLVGGERSDRQRGKILLRRLGVLFLFAMLHGFGIWWGDILSLYAVTGLVMFFFRSWSPRTLMVAGVILFSALTLRQLPLDELPGAPPADTAQAAAAPSTNDDAMAERRKARVAADLAEAKGSWAGAYRVNTRQYLHLLSGDMGLILPTLSLMMIGLSLFKSGFLAGRSSTRRYALVAGTGAVALGILAWLAWRRDIGEAPVPGDAFIEKMITPWVSLAYAAGLILLLKAGAVAILSPLAAAGRMAFTNYLTQSLIMTTIFYGGRGALMGEIDRPGLWALVVGIWGLQLIWSPLWLSRFEMGPFEWAWRSLTHGRRLPILKPR